MPGNTDAGYTNIVTGILRHWNSKNRNTDNGTYRQKGTQTMEHKDSELLLILNLKEWNALALAKERKRKSRGEGDLILSPESGEAMTTLCVRRVVIGWEGGWQEKTKWSKGSVG
jgi:hypothetical protein